MTIGLGTLGRRIAAAGAALALSTGLSGCISFGPEPPEALLTLTALAEQRAPVGVSASGTAEEALVVREPRVAQRLNYARVPVHLSDSSIAYLQDALWVDKPAKLFQQLMTETIRARTGRLVVEESDIGYRALTSLTGQLLDMGYDATSRSVTVRFDAVLETSDNRVLSRRFESAIPGIAAEVTAVGPALNVAANDVAAQVADWVAQGSAADPIASERLP